MGSIDVLNSPVISCWRCYFDGTLIRRGRLYFETTILTDQHTIEKKPDSFIDWADRVLRRVRKHLTMDPASTRLPRPIRSGRPRPASSGYQDGESLTPALSPCGS